MNEFVYKISIKGKETSGVVEADDAVEAATKLKEQGGYILQLKRRWAWGDWSWEELGERWAKIFSGKMKGSDKVLFTTQLGAMLKTGLPIVEAIEAFVEDRRSGSAVILKEIIGDLKRGQKLSAAMAAHPRTFDKVYVNVVRAGEEMGTLGETLVYLGQQLKREINLVNKVRSALIYPMVVLTAMIGVMSFIMIFVVPKIAEFAAQAGASLPGATVVMIKMVEVMKGYWWGIAGAGVGLGVIAWQGIKTKRGKKWVDGVILKMPVLGELVKRYNQVRFAWLLSGFFKYGISVAEAFDILQESLGNSYYAEACARLKAKLTLGRSFSAALETEKELFPPIMARVIKGAERTGELDASLRRLAKFYEGELRVALKNLTSLIEPVLIVFLGIGVVGVALAVILPVYKVTSQIR